MELAAVIAVVLLLVLLAGITWMRIKGLQIDMTHRSADQASLGGGNPFAAVPGLGASMPLPDGVVDASRAAQANVKTLYLFHHDPSQTDDDIEKKHALSLNLVQELGSPMRVIAPAEGDTFVI